MKRSFPVLFCLAAVIMAGVSCRQPMAPEYYGFQDLQVGAGSGNQALLSTTLKFYNPNPFGVQLKKAELDVMLNGKPAGHSVLDSTIQIPKLDTFYVPVQMQVNLQSLLGNALQILLEKKVNVTLDGRVHLRRGMVSISRPFHYEGKEDISELLQGRY